MGHEHKLLKGKRFLIIELFLLFFYVEFQDELVVKLVVLGTLNKIHLIIPKEVQYKSV